MEMLEVGIVEVMGMSSFKVSSQEGEQPKGGER